MGLLNILNGGRNASRSRNRNRTTLSIESMEGKLLLSAASITMLAPGESIVSENQQYRLLLDTNGDLAEYNTVGNQLWHTHSAGQTATELDLKNGNLVLMGTGSKQLWASNSGGHAGSYLDVQDDGDVVMDDRNSNRIWHSNTAQSPTPTPTPTTTQVFAPFVDVTDGSLSDPASLTKLATQTGANRFSLGFITPDASGNPVWGDATYGIDSTYGKQVAAAVKQFQAQGGDVVISFGGQGATGGVKNGRQEMAQIATSTADLAAKDQRVIDAYHVTHLDFDVEGDALADATTVDLRSQALAILEGNNSNLVVSFTLPVEVNGLQISGEYNAMYVLQSAINAKVKFSTVNLMTMDFDKAKFTEGYSQDNAGNDMAHYIEKSATAVVGQLRALQPGLTSQQAWGMIGLTPEVGANDGKDATEIFDPTNAQQLETWAENQGVGELSMWSVQRDGWIYTYGISGAFNRFGKSSH